MSFITKELELAGHALPSSIPLIIERDVEWDWEKNQLVKSESNSTAPLKVVKEALELLSSIDKPIAVLSVCGPYRTGKSYLISSILGNPGAFKIGHSMDSCTRGVWMSTVILEREDLAVVLLDTEGMDSVDGSSKAAFINKMLIVTTLLSSLLIYNSMGVPEWSDLEELRYVHQAHFTHGVEELYLIFGSYWGGSCINNRPQQGGGCVYIQGRSQEGVQGVQLNPPPN